MSAQRIHIVPHEQGWALKREGEAKLQSVHSTQAAAIDAGRDLARQDESDLVVHRQDGTFRNVLTYTNEAMNDNSNNNSNDNPSGKKVEAHDLFSVGSRISWSAVLAGTAIALAVSAVLWMGGLALGLTVHDRLGPRALTIAGALWVLVSTLLALFLGGFVVSRITTGENKTEAALYGVTLWGVLFALATLMGATGASTVSQMVNMGSVTDRTPLAPDAYRDAGFNKETMDRLDDIYSKSQAAASEIDPKAAAWWSFASIALSLGAAVLGALTGAGPGIVFVRFRGQRQETAQIQPS